MGNNYFAEKDLPEDISVHGIFKVAAQSNDPKVLNFINEGNFEELIRAVESKKIYHNDLESYHWFFDFEFNGFWVSGGQFHWLDKKRTKITLELYV